MATSLERGAASKLGWVVLVALPATATGQVAEASRLAESPSPLRRAWSVQPRLGISETLTDNVALSAAGPKSDRVTEISPGVRVEARSARIQAYADYALRELIYANDTARNRTQNSLNAFGSVEAVEDRFFVDFRASVSEVSASAFAPQSQSNVNVNANAAETSVFHLSPHLRGRLGGYATYEIRYDLGSSRSEARIGNAVVSEEWIARVGGQTPQAALSWDAQWKAQEIEYGNGTRSTADTVEGKVSYSFAQQYKPWAKLGRESNDFASLSKTSHAVEGIGFDWTPDARTRLSIGLEKRFFGDNRTVDFSHRTPRTVWKFTESRQVSVLPNQRQTSGLGNVYDMLFTQFTSRIPDPQERSEAVSKYLRGAGIPPDMLVTSGFLSARISVEKRRDLSLAILGVRNVVALAATQSERQALDSRILGDDFDDFPLIRQTGFSMNWTYKLSPVSSLSATASRQHSKGSGQGAASTASRSFQFGLQTRMGADTRIFLSLRRSEFENQTGPVAENATTAMLSLNF